LKEGVIVKEAIKKYWEESKVRSRKFPRSFLIQLLNEEKSTYSDSVGFTVSDKFVTTFRNVEHYCLIFRYKGAFYQIPYIVLDSIVFGIDLRKYNGKQDIHEYVEELSSLDIDFDEQINCKKVTFPAFAIVSRLKDEG
jgi:hypothetical protein